MRYSSQGSPIPVALTGPFDVAKGRSSGDLVPCPLRTWSEDAYSMAFWRRRRSPEDDSRSRRDHPAGVGAKGVARLRTSDGPALEGVVFKDGDWDQIESFLRANSRPAGTTSGHPEHFSGSPRACTASEIASSLGTVQALRASLSSRILPAGPVVDALLDVWTVVHQVDPEAAKPMESLLSSLARRDLASAREVKGVCDQVETALKAERDRRDQAEQAGPGIGQPLTYQTTGTTAFSRKGLR
jgi:hypothetical protein